MIVLFTEDIDKTVKSARSLYEKLPHYEDREFFSGVRAVLEDVKSRHPGQRIVTLNPEEIDVEIEDCDSYIDELQKMQKEGIEKAQEIIFAMGTQAILRKIRNANLDEEPEV